MTVSRHFSATYSEARTKFLDACADRNLDVESHLNDRAKGAEGEDLFMDVARIGPQSARKILIISSATHGGEGFCGSGIQIGLLREGYFTDLPADTAVLFIHAINPYGFSHVRRVNEDNIDLNRNFRDFSKPLPDNAAYREVHPMVLPADWDGPAREKAEADIQDYIARHDLFTFQSAVTSGQHVHADGVFYGGTAPSWSNDTLRAVVKQHAADAEHVASLDLHTGLGPYGFGELIYVGDPNGVERAMNWYDGEVTSPDAGTSTSPVVEGSINFGISESSPKATHTCVAIEYGTIPVLEVLGALRADNWLYIHGDLDSDLGRSIKKQVRDAFYCDKDDWKEMVCKRANETVTKALKGLEAS